MVWLLLPLNELPAEVCEVSDISGDSLWQLVIVGSLWCQCFSLMVKELENFSLPLFRDNRREDLPPGLFICTDFHTAFFHYIIFQQTVEKLTWYPKAKPKLASGSWLFTSIASLLHTNWKDVDSTVKYCCRLLRSYYFMTCESVLQENYYFCNTTLLKSVFSGGRPSELHHNIHTISGIYFLPIKHELMGFWWHFQELMRLTSASGLLVFYI